MEYRKEKRIDGVKKITIEDEGQQYDVVLTGLSKNGLSVKSHHVFPTYKEIDIIIELESNNPIQIKGSVRWVNENIQDRRHDLNDIGILLENPPTAYLDYINSI